MQAIAEKQSGFAIEVKKPSQVIEPGTYYSSMMPAI